MRRECRERFPRHRLQRKLVSDPSWSNAVFLWRNFGEIVIEIQIFSFKKMRLKASSGKWRPFCFGLIVLFYAGKTCSRRLWCAYPMMICLSYESPNQTKLGAAFCKWCSTDGDSMFEPRLISNGLAPYLTKNVDYHGNPERFKPWSDVSR